MKYPFRPDRCPHGVAGMMGRVTNDDAKLPVTAPLTDLAADLGVATRFTAHNGEETTVSRETILKILAALDVDLGEIGRASCRERV